MRVLVTGGRHYNNYPRIMETLAAFTPTVIIHGGCVTGADALAGQFAFTRSIPVEEYRAEWVQNGLAAGPIRNSKMIAESKPDIVVAFPGGRGTADCVKKAKAKGIPVYDLGSTPEELASEFALRIKAKL